jgi:hypothetical protein
MAALVAGGLLGFLFGIPRTVTTEGTAQAGVRANTNLEQISDWLTKILVGISLTQIPAIGDAAGRLVDTIAPALNGGSFGVPMAGGLLVFFSVLGFLFGWLLTRLALTRAIRDVDDPSVLLERAAVETDQGNIPEAERLIREALPQIQVLREAFRDELARQGQGVTKRDPKLPAE